MASCRQAKFNLKDTDKNGKVIMMLERTPCFGACPVFKATLYQNGLLIYEGKRFTLKTGCFYARVPKKEMNKLNKWFADAGFFNLKDQYPENDVAPTDLPSCNLFFNKGNAQKTINDKNWNTPEPLTRLESKLETWINIQNLQSCDK